MVRLVHSVVIAALVASSIAVPAATAVAQEAPPPLDKGITVVGGVSAVSDYSLAYLDACAGAQRLAGPSRYATARDALTLAEVSGGTVFVAQGRTFADALPAGAAANTAGSALVLVEPDTLPAPSVTALDRMTPDRVAIVGGTSVVSPSVEQELRDRYGDVVRIAGPNRYETAIALSQFRYPDDTATAGVDTVILATGSGFIDALASAPLAAYRNAPLLLVPPDFVPPSLVREIRRLDPSEILVIGGTGAVPTTVTDEISASVPGVAVNRVAGANRFETAKRISELLPEGPQELIAVTAYDFPDALVAGSVARTRPLVLMGQIGLTSPSASVIARAMSVRCPPTTKLSTFTTYHPSGQSRVINIHRIADETDGAVVLPGETFSLNEHVGQRTEADGYVAAGAIIGGVLYCCDHPANIGGGTSQFTTTLYNATFYAALEDVAHKPHSIYFSRYPLGIEATLSYPTPDLAFRNDTDFPVLIDASYTSTSITVDIWGWNDRRVVDAEVLGFASTSAGGDVTVIRTITYPDGTTSSRTWYHRYKPLVEQEDPPPEPDPTPPPPPPPGIS